MPDSYIIHLTPYHSLRQHSVAISNAVHSDINPHVDNIFDFIRDKVVYVGKAIDEELLAAVRSDEEFEHVSCNLKVRPDAMLDWNIMLVGIDIDPEDDEMRGRIRSIGK